MPNVLVDYHHSDLFYSFQLLAKRMGWNLFKPVGLEWFEQGYWTYANASPTPRDTAGQFLSVDPVFVPNDDTPVLNTSIESHGGIHKIADTIHGGFHYGITYEAFRRESFDIIISSYSGHEEPWSRLAKEKSAKHIQQIGNIWQTSNAKNQLVATYYMPPAGTQAIHYHPEFDLNVFKYQEPHENKLIVSFINCLKEKGEDYRLWNELKAQLPDYEFKSFGGQCDDGGLHTSGEIAEWMGKSRFVYHVKTHGDGYGFNLFHTYACGRPVITRYSDYQDKLGAQLLKPGQTFIHIDQAKETIKQLDQEGYKNLCRNSYDAFKEAVDFDKESELIKQFFNNLV